jgi:hypothetical protein
VKKVKCSNSGTFIAIEILKIRSTEKGEIEIEIYGIINPSSFKRSGLFKAVYTTDEFGFLSQAASTLDNLYLQTTV